MSHDDNGKKGFVGSEERLKKPAGAERQSRESEGRDRINEDGTAFSAEERRQMLRNEFVQEALPTPPERPGYHRCWLSTTNSYDPIHKRIRMGYTPVRADDIPGFESFRMKGAQWDGVIGCNEMVLFEIPNEIYQQIMVMFHHEMPLEEEQAIKERALATLGKSRRPIEDQLEEGVVSDTLEYLGRAAKIPTFPT